MNQSLNQFAPSSEPIDEAASSRTFTHAANAVLRYLRQQCDLGMWSVSRAEGNDWILLKVDDRAYNVSDNTILKWEDSFCSRMVRGEGPMFDHDVKASATYCDAPIGRQLKIGAYIGIPLRLPDGTLFGTLCGIDPEPHPAFSETFKASIMLASVLLSLILSQEIREFKASHKLREAIAESHLDALTGVANRRGWESRVAEEEFQLQPLAEPACAVVIDLDELKEINDTQGHSAGDDLLRAAADALKASLRTSDFVARIGGDEFAVLAVSCTRDQAQGLVDRIRDSFSQHKIAASVGMAMRRQDRPLKEAFHLADQRMLEEKRQRKSS
ncbi:MAG: GGDEF domain-containing protein [Xanthomonadaceae bacterium]|nr:GGDEF domain-containing protein [Xanthomonadaceae bacterium]